MHGRSSTTALPSVGRSIDRSPGIGLHVCQSTDHHTLSIMQHTHTQGSADPLGAGGRWVKSTKDKYAEQPIAVTQTTIPGFEVRCFCFACCGVWYARLSNPAETHIHVRFYRPTDRRGHNIRPYTTNITAREDAHPAGAHVALRRGRHLQPARSQPGKERMLLVSLALSAAIVHPCIQAGRLVDSPHPTNDD